jgi:uncharacterized protein YecE (DUF72 family)
MGVAIVYAHSADYPEMADITADFVYARLQSGDAEIETGYPPEELDEWARRAVDWSEGRCPDDLPRIDPDVVADEKARDVFAFFIREGKVRAPHAAMAMMECVRRRLD